VDRAWGMGHGAWGMGHGAWGMGHGAWGMGHEILSHTAPRPNCQPQTQILSFVTISLANHP
jgi:hypothetical protein